MNSCSLKWGPSLKSLGGELILFDLEKVYEAKDILHRGRRVIKEMWWSLREFGLEMGSIEEKERRVEWCSERLEYCYICGLCIFNPWGCLAEVVKEMPGDSSSSPQPSLKKKEKKEEEEKIGAFCSQFMSLK